MILSSYISAVQAKLNEKHPDLNLSVDGLAGPATWKAIYDDLGITGSLPPASGSVGTISARSAAVIATLHPNVRPYAEALIHECQSRGIHIEVTSGYRSYEEQEKLYEQGRSKPGKIVTNAKPGFSSHNFATAFDITVFDGKTPVWESPLYKAIGAIGQSIGLSWGGAWLTQSDEPHFYLKPDWAQGMSESAMMAGLRKRVDEGKSVFLA